MVRWLLLLLTGCGASPLMMPCAKRITGAPGQTVMLALSGRAAQVDLNLPMLVSCAAGNPVATSVVTELIDPAGTPLSHEVTAPTSSDNEGYSTTVRFVPRAAGVYHLEARFEPALGVAQRQVQVVADRAADEPAGQFLPRWPCLELNRVGRFFACLSVTGLELWRAGQSTWRPASAMTSAGVVLWVQAEGSITRLEDVGRDTLDELTLATPDVSLQRGAASEAQLLMVTGGRVDEVRLEGGKLVRGRVVDATAHGRASTSGVLRISADEVGYGSLGEVCVVSLVDAGASCTKVALVVGGAEKGVLWAREDEGTGFGVVRFTDGVAAWTPFPARAVGLVDGHGVTPVFRWDGRVVVPRTEDLVLEAWPFAKSYGVGEGVVWLVDETGEVRVFAR